MIFIADFWTHWIWPAGLSGGIPGDVFATLIWVVIAAIVSTIIYPPLRHRIEAWLHHHLKSEQAELHAKLDHIIRHHPDIPDFKSKS